MVYVAKGWFNFCGERMHEPPSLSFLATALILLAYYKIEAAVSFFLRRISGFLRRIWSMQ
jgi:hypothetical protein